MLTIVKSDKEHMSVLCSIFILNTLCKLEMISNKLSLGFPGGSDGKESVCNAADQGLISESGRCPGEGNCYLLQYSLEKAWQPTPVLLLGKSHGWRRLEGCSSWGRQGQTRLSDFTFTFHFHELEKEMATHSSVLAWRIPDMGEPGGLPSLGSHRVGHD